MHEHQAVIKFVDLELSCTSTEPNLLGASRLSHFGPSNLFYGIFRGGLALW